MLVGSGSVFFLIGLIGWNPDSKFVKIKFFEIIFLFTKVFFLQTLRVNFAGFGLLSIGRSRIRVNSNWIRVNFNQIRNPALRYQWCVYRYVNEILLDKGDTFSNIKYHFNHKLVKVDLDKPKLTFAQTDSPDSTQVIFVKWKYHKYSFGSYE